jgi:hypothetical protein
MAIVEELANAQIRRIPHTKGGGMGIFATEDIWHGQEVMLVNREQPSEPEDTSWASTAEAPQPSQKEVGKGNQQEPGAGVDPTVYSPMESGWKMHTLSNPWRDGKLVQYPTPTPVNNIPGWEALTQEFNTKQIMVAEEPGLRKDLWLTCLNCGGLSAVEQRKTVNMAKVTTICWQFMRCGTDVMYLLDTRLSEPQGRKAIKAMRELLPHGTVIRQSPIGVDLTPRDNGTRSHWPKGTPKPPITGQGGRPVASTPLCSEIGGMLLIVSNK